VWFGAFILGSFFVMSISAWYLLKGRHAEFAKRSFTGGLLLGTIASLLQLASGHFNADMVAEYQPAKLAAFEGIFETSEGGTPLYLFGWPDEEQRLVKAGVAVPHALSLLVHMDPDEPVPGLDQLHERYGTPPVWLSFQTYHLMVALGMLFIASTLLACFFWWRGTLFFQRWLLWFFVFAVMLAFVANELGWVAAEVGRQPWVVYPSWDKFGVWVEGLRTADGVSEVVTADLVIGSIAMFGVIYVLLFALWIFLLNRAIQLGPQAAAPAPAAGGIRPGVVMRQPAAESTDRELDAQGEER
jgi:cytochrome d ubiquinol oxidase subunit I